MKRGDIVSAGSPGDYGKPRRALIVQADLFNETHASVAVCPITSHLEEAPLIRVPLSPSKKNGLRKASQVMVDKIVAVKRERIRRTIGRIEDAELVRVDRALRLWLDLEV